MQYKTILKNFHHFFFYNFMQEQVVMIIKAGPLR